jgi:hypothetical protein
VKYYDWMWQLSARDGAIWLLCPDCNQSFPADDQPGSSWMTLTDLMEVMTDHSDKEHLGT